jgi:NTP pyrophosphatase (non-canonical NTP hydrolase)
MTTCTICGVRFDGNSRLVTCPHELITYSKTGGSVHPVDGTGLYEPITNFDQYQRAALRTNPPATHYDVMIHRMSTRRMAQLIHAILGFCSELGELADPVKKYLVYGKELDWPNISEELGDIDWYRAIAISAVGEIVPGVSMQSVADMNIDKLRRRYPSKFTEQHATNRDLEKEREVFGR